MTELKLTRIWEEVLQTYRSAFTITFRAWLFIKGDGTRCKIAKECSVQIPLSDVFSYPTVEELAKIIGEAEENPFASIEKTETKETYPVSSAQNGCMSFTSLKMAVSAITFQPF